ncbi:MAG TPA: DUF6132 family protein [Bacteroidia bacterium]|nr:DUF6132 family protein [Bacteroidia bacterium]
MTTLLKYKWTLVGILIGAIAGYMYWNYVGCVNGTCMITSVWYRSTLYGALMGGLAVNSFSVSKTNNS